MDYKVIKPGYIEYKMEVKEAHLATRTAMHGGAMSGFMDGVMGVAALSAVESEEKAVSTIEFKINYLFFPGGDHWKNRNLISTNC